MKKDLIDANRIALIQALNDLDDIRQFFFGNLKALVEKSDSVDKRLFEQNRVRLKELTLLLTDHFTGISYSDPMDAAHHLQDHGAVPTEPVGYDELTVRQLRALLAVWPTVDDDGNEMKVRVSGPEKTAFPVEVVSLINDGDLFLRHK